MKSTDQIAGSDRGREARGVLCFRCDHLNRPGTEVCSRCGESLLVKCPQCGAKVPQVYARCQTCGKSVPSRATAPSRKPGKMTNLIRVLVLFGTLGAIIALIYFGVKILG